MNTFGTAISLADCAFAEAETFLNVLTVEPDSVDVRNGDYTQVSLLSVPTDTASDAQVDLFLSCVAVGNLAVDWVVHVISGVFILGPLFAILCPRLPTDTPETKGIVFAVGAWILMMAAIVMFGNYRTFTAGAGFGTFAWLLITHAVFGIVLGNVYARLVARDKRMGATIIGGAHAH